MAEGKTEAAEISPIYETSLASIKAAELTKKEEAKRLYGWLMGRVLKNKESIKFGTKGGFGISVSSLGKELLSTSPRTEHLDHAVYISRDLLFTSSIVHNAFLVCPDGNIFYVGYEDSGEEFLKRLGGKRPDYTKRDLSMVKPADIKVIEYLTKTIRDEILPEVLGTSKK